MKFEFLEIIRKLLKTRFLKKQAQASFNKLWKINFNYYYYYY